jgi:hypothetical protein
VFNGYYSGIKEPDLIFIDVVADTKEGTVIYSGYLINFDFTNGELERVYLKDTLKRDFLSKKGTAEPYEIPGDIFSIAYKTILNINMHFIILDNSLDEIENLPDEGNE